MTDSGVALSSGFLDLVAADSSKGVLMVEGIAALTKPLVLEIWKDGNKVAENELNLLISGVEDRYRWIQPKY